MWLKGVFKVAKGTTIWCLAHLSRRLKWAIVIAHRPSVVRPSSSSVNFHIFVFLSRTTWWILMKLGRDEVFMIPYKCCCFSARSAQGWIQGGAKIGHWGGVPVFKKLLLQTGKLQGETECKAMIYVGGSKSSETNPIPENRLILSAKIMILLLEASVPDRTNASPWLADDVIKC